MKALFLIPLLLFACKQPSSELPLPEVPVAYLQTKTIHYNNLSVKVVIDKPALNELDVLLLFHGTVANDSSILTAANNTLDKFKGILDRKDMLLVSVAYPQQQLLLGDNIAHAEAALLWLKNQANQELGITVKKIFLGGHSQGGYLVTRLNTMHPTNGVIANAPGPLNLVYRCQLEENQQIQPSAVCNSLRAVYGTTTSNPTAYFGRSLLNFTNGFKANILFVQGLNDSPIQMYSWPSFKQDVQNCANCQSSQFVEIAGAGHGALFENATAKAAFNAFLEGQ